MIQGQNLLKPNAVSRVELIYLVKGKVQLKELKTHLQESCVIPYSPLQETLGFTTNI